MSAERDAATTAHARELVAASCNSPDASFAAGLADAFAAACPEVQAWLYGDAPDCSTPEGFTTLGYRSVFAGEPPSSLSDVGELIVYKTTTLHFVLGTVMAATDEHPFAHMGAQVTGIPFSGQALRRRFAVNLGAPCFQRVEVALLTDGARITHERCLAMMGGGVGGIYQEVITWHHGDAVVPGRPAAAGDAALRLLQRPWRRREPCLMCAPYGEAVPQPCPHKVNRVVGVTFGGWEDFVRRLSSRTVHGTAHFELQQPALLLAGGRPPLIPATAATGREAVGTREEVDEHWSPIASAALRDDVPGALVAQGGGGDAPAVALDPVSYEFQFFNPVEPLSYFDALRQTLEAPETEPVGEAHLLGPPADTAGLRLDTTIAGGESSSHPQTSNPGASGRGWAPRTHGTAPVTDAHPDADSGALTSGTVVAAELAPTDGGGRLGIGPRMGDADAEGGGCGSAVVGGGRSSTATTRAVSSRPVRLTDATVWVGTDEATVGSSSATAPTLHWLQAPSFEWTGYHLPAAAGSSAVHLSSTAPMFPATVPGPGARSVLPPPSRLVTELIPTFPTATPSIEAQSLTLAESWSMPHDVFVGAPPSTRSAPTVPLSQSLPESFRRPPLIASHHSEPPPRPRPHACRMCGSSFLAQSDLARHVETVHHRLRRWQCPSCEFQGLQKGHLTTHIASVHATERRYVCPECPPGPNAFRGVTRSAVQRHSRRVHQGLRPYVCVTCGSSFASTSDLTRHRRRLHQAVISTRSEALRAREEATAAAAAAREAAAADVRAGSPSASGSAEAGAPGGSVGSSSGSGTAASRVQGTGPGYMAPAYGAASSAPTLMGAVASPVIAAQGHGSAETWTSGGDADQGPSGALILDEGSAWSAALSHLVYPGLDWSPPLPNPSLGVGIPHHGGQAAAASSAVDGVVAQDLPLPTAAVDVAAAAVIAASSPLTTTVVAATSPPPSLDVALDGAVLGAPPGAARPSGVVRRRRSATDPENPP